MRDSGKGEVARGAAPTPPEVNLEFFLENVPLGIYFVEPGGKGEWVFSYVNDKLCEITGYSREELIGTNALNIIHPTYRSLVKSLAERRYRGEKIPDRYTTMIRRKDGEVRLINLMPRRAHFKGKTILFGIVEDLTDVERLNQTYHLFISALQRSNVGVLASEGDFVVSKASSGAARILGYPSPKKMEGRRIPEVLSVKEPERRFSHRSSGDERLKQFLITGELEGTLSRPTYWEGEMVKVDLDSGEEKYLLVEVTAFPGVGKEVYMLVLFMDETPLINALRRADTYLDIIIHDIANFITPVYGYLDFVQANFPLSGPVRHYLNTSRRGLEKISRFLNSVRLLSAVEKLGVPTEDAPSQILIEDAVESVFGHSKCPLKEVKIRAEDVEIPAAEVFLSALLGVLSQIEQDLPDDCGGVTIDAADTDGEYTVWIEFPSERDLNTYYPLFLRRFETLESEKKGTGLWLSLSKDLLKSVGGTLHLETIGRGKYRLEIRYPLVLSDEIKKYRKARGPIL
ncbi:MAG: PAS domain S-box protein [Thermoplasmata archaeon]|nr:PAS domain S-box protein [Thermoplasmata archaeon]